MAEVGHNQEREAQRVAERDARAYLSLYNAVQNGAWKTLIKGIGVVNDILVVNGIPIDTSISWFRENLLHVIVCRDHSTKFLKALTRHVRFDPGVLLQTDCNGKTALFLAAMAGNTKAAKIMVDLKLEVLTIEDSTGRTPVIVAASLGHKVTADYLLTKMIGPPPIPGTENLSLPIFGGLGGLGGLDGVKGVLLLNVLITASFYDLANHLLDRFPNLAYGIDSNGKSPLERFVERPQMLCSTINRRWNGTIITLVYHKEIERHLNETRQLIKAICQSIHNYTQLLDAEKTVSELVRKPLLEAAKLGIYEIVTEIINTWPYMVFATNEKNETIYHFAAQYRHENIFNLIWNLGPNRHRILMLRSENGTSILHLAARLGATTTSRISGAALQMRRELQWFMAVENMMETSMREETDSGSKTPWMVFTDEHKDLVKDGEDWMKKVASACSVVAALIVTVVFTAAFKPPDKYIFPVFISSDFLALFLSSTSLMAFLSILTSRFSEIDFLYTLPIKLIVGIFMLFSSMLCMFITYSSNYYFNLLNYSDDFSSRKEVIIAIFLVPSFLVVLFVFMVVPPLIETLYSIIYRGSVHEEFLLKDFLHPLLFVANPFFIFYIIFHSNSPLKVIFYPIFCLRDIFYPIFGPRDIFCSTFWLRRFPHEPMSSTTNLNPDLVPIPGRAQDHGHGHLGV